MTSSNQSSFEQRLNKLFFQGGLQRYFARDEARIYNNNLYLDSFKHCITKFDSNEPNEEEKDCIRNFMIKNYQLLKRNLQ
jgi:hypothetical protein